MKAFCSASSSITSSHSLVLQRSVGGLSLQGRVPSVLDCIVCAAWEQLRDNGPLVAIDLMCLWKQEYDGRTRCCDDARIAS